MQGVEEFLEIIVEGRGGLNQSVKNEGHTSIFVPHRLDSRMLEEVFIELTADIRDI